MLKWKEVKDRYAQNPWSRTKTGRGFRVNRVTDGAIFLDLPSGKQSISRVLLEKAVEIISKGRPIEGPAEYKRLVGDERPAYAWAIRRDMGYV